MNLHESQLQDIQPFVRQTRLSRWAVLGAGYRLLLCALAAFLVLLFAGASAPDAESAALQRLRLHSAGHHFDVLRWESGALTAKVGVWFSPPASALSGDEGAQLVRAYVQRAQYVQELENSIARQYSQRADVELAGVDGLQAKLDLLRQQQVIDRPAVEQVIERQVAQVLAEEGLAVGGYTLPPVQFAFVEPPKKLIVSPRERIATIYGEMLDATISLREVEATEAAIRQEQGLSAYVTSIGGLGAYPTMVIDNAGLAWILSTVAHEWTHNYLTFFPLGFNYGANSDIIIINETVAELVGNEIGDKVLRRYYPDLAPPSAQTPADATRPTPAPTGFDFNAEMRETRQTVDILLAQGKVDAAEAYMDERRQFFVKRGYPLRVLNQAYFAFHGSYGTGAASTSPLGPQLERLRAHTPDVKTYLQIVRSFTSPAHVERALLEWEGRFRSE
jgi:hypothetical protein